MTQCHRVVVVQMGDTIVYLYATGRQKKNRSSVQENSINKGGKSLGY